MQVGAGMLCVKRGAELSMMEMWSINNLSADLKCLNEEKTLRQV